MEPSVAGGGVGAGLGASGEEQGQGASGSQGAVEAGEDAMGR